MGFFKEWGRGGVNLLEPLPYIFVAECLMTSKYVRPKYRRLQGGNSKFKACREDVNKNMCGGADLLD